MRCPKCRNERFFTYTTRKVICGNCGNQMDYQETKLTRHHDGEFFDVGEIAE